MKKTVLITGASRGIGKAISKSFAKAGYEVYMCCRQSISELEQFAAELKSEYGITATALPCDVSDAKQVEALFSSLPTLDVVVNNAGISRVNLITDTSIEEWNEVVQTNLSSMFYVSKLAIPGMLQKGSGRIINISSVWGNVGASMEVAYSASKGGVNAFTKALAKELAPSNIQVNAIACGVIDTEMNNHLSAEDKEALVEEIPADRMGQPEEIGALALQLATAPAYMTGQILTIDGGWY